MVVLFDIGDVLVRTDKRVGFFSFLESRIRRPLTAEKLQWIRTHITNQLELGTIEPEDAAIFLAEELGIDYSFQEFRTAISSAIIGHEDELTKYLKFLTRRGRFKLLVASNLSILDDQRLCSDPELTYLSKIDGYRSYKMGLRKPDPAFYNRILEVEQEPPEGLLYLDDRDENIAAATAVGIPSIKFNIDEGPKVLRQHLIDKKCVRLRAGGWQI